MKNIMQLLKLASLAASLLLLISCGGGGGNNASESDATQIVGTWEAANNLKMTFTPSNRYTAYENGVPAALGVIAISGSQLSMTDHETLGSCGSATGLYQVSISGNTLTLTDAGDSCATRVTALTAGAWSRSASTFP
jgi:hypothetical protein